MKDEFRVYVIENPDGKRYIGLSSDVEIRVQQHNENESRYTKNKGPWNLLWVGFPGNLSEARKLENLMKRQKGGAGLNRLMAEFGDFLSGS